MKIATWNINSIRLRLQLVIDFIKEHDVDVVGEALRPTVHGMERVAGERRGILPLVVGLVQRLVPDHTATHVESGPALYHSSRDRPPTGWGGATSGAPSR